jgi:uncharacterized protein
VQQSKILLKSHPVEHTVVSPCKNQEQNGRRRASLKMEVPAQSYASALDETYGDRLDRVVLFGSHARGEARPNSDYDIAVFLRDPDSFWKESGRLAEIETDILYATGAIINALPFPAGAYRERTPLMHEVRREGVDL